MKTLYLLILVSTQALAWPWTTVDDCVSKYAPNTESNQGVKIISLACAEKYQKKYGYDDYAECVFDRVPTAKTDSAATLLARMCLKENPPPAPQTDYWTGFEEFRKSLAPPKPVMTREDAITECFKVPQTEATFDACVHNLTGK